MTAVRPPVLAGSWYPAEPAQLRRDVDGYLAGAEPERAPAGTPVIALAPHAGYAYSGAVAGKVLGNLRERRYAAVFVLAPSHRKPLPRPALSSLEAFATPLGQIPLARGICDDLAASGAFVVDDRAHAFEHAVEILLPLLQRALPDGTPIVPVLVPHLEADARREAAAVLSRWRDGRHLFLVSSDLTHYGREYGYVPFDHDVPHRLEELDTGALLKFLAHDPDGLLDYAARTGITMCGLDAAALALGTGEAGTHEGALLDYARSADATGDWSFSVSYAGALISDPAATGEVAPPVATGDAGGAAGPQAGEEPTAGTADTAAPLTDQERAFLVELARRAVAAAASSQVPPDPTTLAAERGVALSPRLLAPRGAFVTLTHGGQLRGCIGYIEGIAPLVAAVVDNAASAAVRDPRFAPVRPEEVAELDLEVSALTPLRPVDGPQEIELGRHGIVLGRGDRRAVFLPQVPGEQGWDLATTLDHLALKAGLPAGAWREGAEFQVFEAEICHR